MKVSYKITVLLIAFLAVQVSVSAQNGKDKFFYDTLVVMDYTTNLASERLSRLNKPLKRTFYLKSNDLSYTLFKGNVAKLTTDQVLDLLDNGFSLYFDKLEYKDHLNLKPDVLEILSDGNEVLETIESLGSVKESTLTSKLKKGTKLRFSGFIVSVNEEKLGPITMDVEIVE